MKQEMKQRRADKRREEKKKTSNAGQAMHDEMVMTHFKTYNPLSKCESVRGKQSFAIRTEREGERGSKRYTNACSGLLR
jgi:hypothetical protein